MGRPAINTPVNRAVSTSSFLAQTPGDYAYSNEPIRLRIAGVRRRGQRGGESSWTYIDTLKVTAISYSLGASDDTMSLTWTPQSAKLDRSISATPEHLSQILELLGTDRTIQAYVDQGDAGERLLFSGYPMPKTIQWTGANQHIGVECLSEGQVRARYGRDQQILGRWMLRDPDIDWTSESPDMVEVTTLAPIFNAGGRPNRSPDISQPVSGTNDPYQIYLFTEDNAPGAEYWSYADALRYVVYWYCFAASKPIDVTDFLADTDEFVAAPHNATTTDPFVRDMTRRADDDVSIQSTNLDEAIAILTDRAGLKYQIAIGEAEDPSGGFEASYELRVFGHMADLTATISDANRLQIQPTLRDLPRDKPFEDYTGVAPRAIAERNAANVARVTIDERPINNPVFLGGYKEYEATFLLRPGWEPRLSLLDDVPQTEEEIAKAVGYWLRQFIDEYDTSAAAAGKRLPVSQYHAEHPDHAAVADVFRLWIFPDSADIDAEALGRYDGEGPPPDPALTPWVWTAKRYRPRDEDNAMRLWYEDSIYGAGLPQAVVKDWVPRYRPFRETIGRANTATDDVTPIVRIHFGNGTPLPPEPFDPGWRPYLDHGGGAG